MRKPKWTTPRWRLPTTLRRRRLRELMSKSDLKKLFGPGFLDGLEKRKRDLERMQWKLLSIQAPIFLVLAFSILNISVNVSVLGISAGASKTLREVLLLISSTFGVASAAVNEDLRSVKEMIKAIVEKEAQANVDLKEFLEVRYGLSRFSPLNSFDADLTVGSIQWIGFFFWAACAFLFLGMLIAIAFSVQIWNLIEVYIHPNVSPDASLFVIAYAVIADIIVVVSWLLAHSVQPYQTYEDFKKWQKLSEKDEAKSKEIIRDMVRKHYSKGLFGQLFGRPKMKSLP